MIQGYSNIPSVLPGEMLRLHVSTDAPQFHVDFYRQGAALEPVGDLGIKWNAGQNAPQHAPDEDWGLNGQDHNGQILPAWKGYDFAVPVNWKSGLYIAVFTEGDADGNPTSAPDTGTVDARDSKACFVVRSGSPGRRTSILYKLSFNTFHAYNYSGLHWVEGAGLNGGSLYDHQAWSSNPPGFKVTMRRPGGGTGGVTTPTDSQFSDVYDQSSPRQTLAHWDVPFISWLEANGYTVEYCADLDVHQNPDKFLASYGLLLSVGHDEYWSEQMRSNVAAFIENGGNVAFFSGNTCWWRIHYVDNDTAFVCDRKGPYGTDPDQYFVIREYEDSLTGVSYRNAGGRWSGARPAVGYTVQHADHWVYQGTGLNNFDSFGTETTQPLVGYECDGTLLSDQRDSQGCLKPAFKEGTPPTFLILGSAFLDPTQWNDSLGSRTATMGLYTNMGTVFTAGTTDWVKALPISPQVDIITHNVLKRLGGLRARALPTIGNIAAIGGFYSPDDSFGHAIVAIAGGEVSEVFYRPPDRLGQTLLTKLGEILAVAGFFSSDDNFRHAIIATNDGNVTERFYNPQQGQGQSVLTNLSGIVAVAGFFSSDDNFRHAIIATNNGNVTEFFYNPRQGQGQSVLTNLPGIVAVASFFSPDDNFRHAIIATNNGNVTEFFYNPQQGRGQSVLTNLPGIVAVGAFFSSDDNFRHAIIATNDGNVTEYFYSPEKGSGMAVLGNFHGVIGVAGFFSSDDNFRHVVVATNDGRLHEVLYHPVQGVFIR
jgi:hypothetical protein